MAYPIYIKKKWRLDSSNREIKEWILFKTFYVEESNANLNNVYISIDNLQPLKLSVLNGIDLGYLTHHLVKITWEESEDGKEITLVFGRERLLVSASLAVKILQDLVGIAKDVTVQNITKMQFDEDNDVYVASRAKEDSIEYTTTNDWGDALVIDASRYDELTIMIKNVGETNSADVEVYTKANSNGQIEYREYGATLAAGDVVKVQLNGKYAQVIVRAKNTETDKSTVVRIEWVGGK